MSAHQRRESCQYRPQGGSHNVPGAWEIIDARRQRVLCAILCPPDMKVSLQWANMFRGLQFPPNSDKIEIRGLPFGPARNAAVKQALDGGYNHLFFLDADTIPPLDVIPRLVAMERDFIGALYYQRFPPYHPAAALGRQENWRVVRQELGDFVFGDVIPVNFLPCGATLISRRCLETVIAKYPRPFEWTLDIDQPGQGSSEDYDFSMKAASLGFQAWLATGLVCKHEIMMVATSRGVENSV